MWCLIVNVNAEKVIVTLVLLSFALTSINRLVVQGRSLTREEAIEISRNSELIRSLWHLVEDADWYTLEAYYLNETRTGELKEQNPEYYEFLPDDHGVWLVTWEIGPSKSGPATIIVEHYIDEETGEILHEGGISLR